VTNPFKAIAGIPGRMLSSLGGMLGGPSPGYDAVKPKGKRANVLGRTLSEDLELRQLQRRQLSTTIRDLNRNFSVVAWMIRQHLDYVSTFHFRSKTGNKELDGEIQSLMEWYSRPENCDPAGRHRFARLVRMWEMRRVIDGDVLVNRLADGKIQTIEGDRIQTTGGIPFADLGITDPNYVVNGVWTTPAGKAISYMVWRRPPQWTGLEWDRAVSARFADLLGYFDRYDQVRGISPIAAAANQFRDLYEGFDYALVKAKVTQLFGIVTTREGSEELGEPEVPPVPSVDGTTSPPVEPDSSKYGDIDFGKGPVMFDLDPGDKVDVIESKQPSDQFQSFTQAMVLVALKSLDIPYSFFSEEFTNYSGARLAAIQYEQSVKIKRGDIKSLLDKITAWRLGLFIADGDLKLPKGMKPRDLKWEWSHGSVAWYDPAKEVTGAVAAVNAGFSSPQRECKKLGLDFFEIIDERAAAEEYAKKQGVIISTALPSLAMDDPANSKTEKEDANEEQQSDDEKPAKAAKKTKGKK
jgi:capsid protein